MDSDEATTVLQLVQKSARQAVDSALNEDDVKRAMLRNSPSKGCRKDCAILDSQLRQSRRRLIGYVRVGLQGYDGLRKT